MRFYLRVSGEILITLGVLVFGFMAYMYWGTGVREASAQRALASELGRQWSGASQSLAVLTSPDDLALGKPLALIRIPAFGQKWQFAVVEGTGLAQLALGPGHVPGTALPGQVGNFAVAGHRVTAGNPFWSLPGLRRGDEILVETITGSYEYKVTGKPVLVPPTDAALLAPVPGHPGEQPHERLITLVTCNPPWTGTERVVVTGILVKTLPRQQGSGG